MPSIPDLVKDSKLETQFHRKYTIHRFYESDATRGTRFTVREEYWTRQQRIGGGGYGAVFLETCIRGAKDEGVRAVKQIQKPQQSGNGVDYNRELEAIMKFSHNRYVRCFVKSYGWFEDNHDLYIAMEYLPYGDLQKHMSISAPLLEPEGQTIAYQLLEGLSFLHENGFAHRDLKLSNILVKSRPPDPWWIKIGDFGISKRVEDGAGGVSTVRGTMGFMSPEVHGFVKEVDRFEKDPYASRAADMWSLGEVIFQVLTKRATFRDMGSLSAYVQDPERFPTAVLQQRSISKTCIDLLQSMMRASPTKRINVEQALLHPWTAVSRVASLEAASVSSQRYSESDDGLASGDPLETSEESAAWSPVTGQGNVQANLAASEPIVLQQSAISLPSNQSPDFSGSTVVNVPPKNDDTVAYSSRHSETDPAETFVSSTDHGVNRETLVEDQVGRAGTTHTKETAKRSGAEHWEDPEKQPVRSNDSKSADESDKVEISRFPTAQSYEKGEDWGHQISVTKEYGQLQTHTGSSRSTADHSMDSSQISMSRGVPTLTSKDYWLAIAGSERHIRRVYGRIKYKFTDMNSRQENPGYQTAGRVQASNVSLGSASSENLSNDKKALN